MRITTAHVLDAIESRWIPQCYEQIARTLEMRHDLPGGSVTSQKLSPHINDLVNHRRILMLADADLLCRLGAFPQHYAKNTKFFIGENIARNRLSPSEHMAALPTAPVVASSSGGTTDVNLHAAS